MAKPRKFVKAEALRSRFGFDDADQTGRVRVYVRLISKENSAMIRGNISRTVTIDGATVTDVADAIDAALFD